MASPAHTARAVKLILDEMHAPGIAKSLTDESFDVIAVAAQTGLRGIPDEDLLSYATAQGRAVVTENVSDYMPLATQWAGGGKAHAGVIFTNPRRFSRATSAYPGNLIVALQEFLTSPPITGESWIWWL